MNPQFSLSVTYGSPAVHHIANSESYQFLRAAALRRLRMKVAEVGVGEVKRQPNYAKVELDGVIVFEATRDEDGTITIDKEILP